MKTILKDKSVEIINKIKESRSLVELLNEYLSHMTDILMDDKGTLDKYEGDAIIAFFGAPMELLDHGVRTCSAAVKMQNRLKELCVKWEGESKTEETK